MSEVERKQIIEDIAQRYSELRDSDKSYIAGYMMGVKEERQRLEVMQQK